jgi:hypothetical protein
MSWQAMAGLLLAIAMVIGGAAGIGVPLAMVIIWFCSWRGDELLDLSRLRKKRATDYSPRAGLRGNKALAAIRPQHTNMEYE